MAGHALAGHARGAGVRAARRDAPRARVQGRVQRRGARGVRPRDAGVRRRSLPRRRRVERQFRRRAGGSVIFPTSDASTTSSARRPVGCRSSGDAMSGAFVLGAVAYDPKVVTIWDGFVRWFAEQGFAFDYVLFTHYERLVEAQFAGAVDCAWNSPLACRSERLGCRAFGRRPAPSPCATPTRTSLRRGRSPRRGTIPRRRRPPRQGRRRRSRLAAGDHPPLALAAQGLSPGATSTYRPTTCSSASTATTSAATRRGEGPARGSVDAACILDGNLGAFVRGEPRARSLRVLTQTAPTTTATSRCSTGRRRGPWRFTELLFAQRGDDDGGAPADGPRGLKAWRPGASRTTPPSPPRATAWHRRPVARARVGPLREGRVTSVDLGGLSF